MAVAWKLGAWATNSWVGMNAGPPNAWRGESTPPPVVTGPPVVGNNNFWLKGNRQIGQTRRWRYWWEKDPCDIPAEIPVAEAIEDVQAEANAVASCITDMVIQRAAEATLQIMRAYYEILQEQIIAKQQKALVEAHLPIYDERKIEEKKILRRKKIMILLNG